MVSSRTAGVSLSAAKSTVVSDSEASSRDADAISSADGTPSYVGSSRSNGSNGLEWSQSGPPSLSMSVDLHNLVSASLQDSGHYSASPDSGTRAGHANDEEESYEGFGSVEADAEDVDGADGADSPGGSSSAPSPTGPNSFRNPRSPNSTIGRHSWLRTSLRRTPPCSGRKRLSTNALASQLYRSGSFNSSGRGSNCDPADDMYSDVSLEDDVIDLNHRSQCNGEIEQERSGWPWLTTLFLTLLLICALGLVLYRSLSRETRRRLNARLPNLLPPLQVQMIQEQMHALVDTQTVGEERYARAKQENATLQARIMMLEEAAKDAEARAEERLQAEQRRHREWVCRLERERQLQLENYAIKVQSIELEGGSLRDEIGRLREQLEKVRTDRARLEGELEESRRETESAREAERQASGRANEAHYQLELAREELSMRLEDQQRIEELTQQVGQLRARNKSLEESRDELQAAAALQAGRELLMLNPCNSNTEKGPSLAVELLAGMNQDQMDGPTGDYGDLSSMSEMKQALKEQQEVNTQLRAYIDGILLNIVENYPQLLEVKQAH